MATHSSVLAWRIPWTKGPGWLQSVGSHRVRHDWSDLAAAAAMWSCQGSMTREEKPCTNTCIVFFNYEEKLFFLNFERSGRQSELPKEVATECAECNFPKAQLTTSLMPFSINTSCGNRPRVKLLVFWFRFGQSIAQNCENLNLKYLGGPQSDLPCDTGRLPPWLLGIKLTSRKSNLSQILSEVS